MVWNPSSPVTGATVPGFTSPTYTLTTDVAPDQSGKQVAITALGGTQAGVTAHNVSSPFTLTFFKPKSMKILGQPNPVTGVISRVDKNTYRVLIRKGVSPLAGQPTQVASIDMTINIPAGSDTADPSNVKAMLSLAIGVLTQQSSGLADTSLTGIP